MKNMVAPLPSWSSDGTPIMLVTRTKSTTGITGSSSDQCINDIVSEQVKELTGINILKQRLAYLMRSGVPDSLDRMVAISYGILAVQEIKAGRTGRMVALQDGNYTTVPVETCVQGKKLVDVEQLYDTNAYRPRIRYPLGKPMFLY